MTSKEEDQKLVKRILDWCKTKYSMEECNSKVLKLYELACKADLYLAGRALNEQDYYDRYGNELYKLAKDNGMAISFVFLEDSSKVRQGKWDDSIPWEEAKFVTPPTLKMIQGLNKSFKQGIDQNKIDRIIGEEAMRDETIGGRE